MPEPSKMQTNVSQIMTVWEISNSVLQMHNIEENIKSLSLSAMHITYQPNKINADESKEM